MANLLKQIAKLPIYLFCNLIYLVSHVIPKDKKLWVFGAWFGQQYADNARYFFEYVQEDESIKAIWISKSKKIVSRIRNMGYTAFLSYSPRGIYYAVKANFAIVSSGNDDINRALTASAVKVNLWHGTPMKKLMYEEHRFRGESSIKKAVRRLLWYFLPYMRMPGMYDMILAASDYYRPIMASAFRISANKVQVLGYPRNDILFDANHRCSYMEKIKEKFDNPKIIGYFPTFRNSDKNGSRFKLMNEYGFDSYAMEDFLRETNSIFLIKFHYVDQKRGIHLNISPDSRLVFAGEKDIPELNEILPYIDVLLTDYSSAYFDFLLLNRPVIFAPFDLEDYTQSRGLYGKYETYLAGPKAKDWKEVISYAKEAISNPEKYENLRISKNEIFNKYQDGKSSMRVFEYLKEYMKKNDQKARSSSYRAIVNVHK